ncbi:sensor histidine kinase [Treponema sp. R8-4-B8]
MKQVAGNYCLFFSFFIFLSFLFISPVYGQNITVPDIMWQWTGIERLFLAGQTQQPMINAIDSFLDTMEAFGHSETYRILRLLPADNADAYSLENITGMVYGFRESAVMEDREKAAFLLGEINEALTRWLALDTEIERFPGVAYFRLSLVFVLFVTLAAVAAFIMKKTLARSLDREAENSAFSQAILIAQEEERGRISRELHDTVAQDLRYLSLRMDKIGRMKEDDEREKLCIETAETQSGLISRLHEICNALVPPDFRILGLADAVQQLCFNFKKRAEIDCRAEITEGVNLDFLNLEKQLQIYRIVQEALTNVEKHAQASEAVVVIRSNQQKMYIGISDDGKGFDAQGDNSHGRLGISGMKKRAAILGGSLTINSISGEGTLVCLEFPVK